MRADKLRPGLFLDGVRIKGRVPFVVNRTPMIRLTMFDGTTRTYRADADVYVGGSRQEWLPAGPIQSSAPDSRKPKPNSKPRMSDGRWEGESGGFHVTMVSRINAYDLPGRSSWERERGPARLRSN